MIPERQAFHKLIPLGTISLLACLSIVILPSAFAQVTNPSTGDTVGTYCSSGICHTPGGTESHVTSPSSITAPPATPVGKLTLSQPCIGDKCNNVTQVTQLGRIGLQLSEVCQKMLVNHMNSTCLNYNDLKQFDNTNPLWAGLWIEQPYEHRLLPKIKNHENFNANPWAIMADPNSDFTTNSYTIIVDDHFNYTNQNEGSIGGLAMKVHVDRYINPDCTEARVGPNLFIINDTINYIESRCTVTNYNDTKIITQKEIPFSYDNPYSTLHYQAQISKVKATGGLGNCITKQCSYTDPYKKIGY